MTTCVSSGLWPPITAVILKTLEHDTKYYYMYEKYTEVLPEKTRFFRQAFLSGFSSCLALALFCFLSKDFSLSWSVSRR